MEINMQNSESTAGRIKELEEQNRLLQQRLRFLEEENQKQQKKIAFRDEHVKELQELVGSWKRKVKELGPRYQFIRESHDGGAHYKEFALNDIPGDLPYREVLRHVKQNVLPNDYPYRYHNLYMSKRYGGWVVKLSKKDAVDMSYAPRDKQITAREKLNQLQWEVMDDIRRWETSVLHLVNDAETKDQQKADFLIGVLRELFAKVQQVRFDGWNNSLE